VIWLALILACGASHPEPPRASMPELPPFEDPAIKSIYERLEAWADGRGWTPTPLRRGGSFLERTWVLGQPGKQRIPAPGTARLELSVLAARDRTSSYGLSWSAGIADTAGKGLHLLVVSDTRGFTPDQVRIDLRSGADAVVEIGAPLIWEVGERTLQTAGPSGLVAVQATLATDQGTSFAKGAAGDLQALEAVVRPVLESGDYTMCDHGPSPGRGIPGECSPRKPTPAEQEAHPVAFDTEMARRMAVIGDGAVWTVLLDSIVPRDL